MKKIFLFLSIFISGLSTTLVAQERCGAAEEFENAMRQNPDAQRQATQYLSDLLVKVRQVLTYLTHPELHQSPVTIPVVVHIVHNNDNENFTNNEVQAVIRELNRFYRKRNTAEIRSEISNTSWRALAQDSYIEFELAKRAPNGDTTSGITRYRTSAPSLTNQTIRRRATRGTDAWDENKYLNFWVGDIPALGYGTFPENPLNDIAHGVAIDFTTFAIGSRSNSSYNEGKTVVHEVGHFLGLRHIWGDRGGDDYVGDTPAAAAANFGCNPTRRHSRNGGGPTPAGEMFVNYMDYSNDACMHMFTHDQVARMIANLKPGGRRASLLTSDALLRPGLRERDHNIYLEAESPNLPAWKASFLMTYQWTRQMSLPFDELESEVQGLIQRQGNISLPRIAGLPQEVSEYANALAYEVEELTMTYTPDAFYDMLTVPVIIMSVGSTSIDTYGLVIKGLGYHQDSNTTYLKVLDPLSVGSRGFNFDYSDYSTPVSPSSESGSEYVVNYSRFMLDAVNNAVINQKRIYILYPPSVGNI